MARTKAAGRSNEENWTGTNRSGGEAGRERLVLWLLISRFVGVEARGGASVSVTAVIAALGNLHLERRWTAWDNWYPNILQIARLP